METKKMIGDYMFTIDENKERDIDKCDIKISEFDCSLTPEFLVEITIYGENIMKYFSRFNQLSYDITKCVRKSDIVFDCTLSHNGGTTIVEMKNAMIIRYSIDQDTSIERITVTCDYYTELNDKTNESIIVAKMVQNAAKKAEENARKYARLYDLL